MRDQDISSANVILLCFSVVDRNTFEEALYVFGRQIRRISMAAVLLVGLKLDLIGTETQHSSVSLEEGFSAAIELQAYGHFQCRLLALYYHYPAKNLHSSKKNIGVENLFVEVCRAGTFAGTFCSPKKPGFFSFFSKKPHRKPKRYKIHSPDVVQAPLAVIPNNIWFEIIYYLDFITLIRLSRTCKHFYHLTKTEPHWTNMSRTEWTYTGHSTTASLGRKAQSFSWDANKCFSRTTSL
ncbi:hypothetical protein Pelo_5483 [Pelomyxa schiedti]|nr:hypothetical protein Pelo_5483 [Pelomyxa schiedti]